MKKLFLLIVLTLFSYTSQSQILISLLLGDKLNSGKIEFGLDGGWNLSKLNGLDNSDGLSTFNLGFYFDLKVFKNPQWMINTGVIVKSTQGADDIPVYSLNNAALDSSFAGGFVRRKVNYFDVPIEMKYVFKNRIFVKGGIMLGLRYKGTDEFINDIEDDEDLLLKIDTRKKYHPIDAGGVVGAGYRFTKGNGMNLNFRYYFGFVDISIDDSTPNQYNQTFYITVGIPIGKGKAAEKESTN